MVIVIILVSLAAAEAIVMESQETNSPTKDYINRQSNGNKTKSSGSSNPYNGSSIRNRN